MRGFVYIGVLLAMTVFSFFYHLPNTCDKPVAYTIGAIDDRFDLTKAQVESSIKEAEQYWETAVGRDLFVYNPAAEKPVTIQMVYDERQAISNQINTEKVDVTQEKSSLQSRIEAFNRKSRELEQDVQAFNQKVKEWNKNANQSKDDYNKLVNEQTELEQRTRQLNAEASTLQESTDDVNVKIDELNGDITSLQTVVKAKPEEGLYESAKNLISIYYNNSRQELVHTIEHELGHSLGLDHISKPDAIMYVQTNQTLIPTSDDVLAVNLICKKETLMNRVRSQKWQQSIRKVFSGII